MFTKEIYPFKNYTLKLSNSCHQKNREALVMLHGFPAEPVLNKELEKNIDIATLLAKSCKFDVFLPHYKGLGRSKYAPFSFIDSITESRELSSELLQTYDSISLFAHSWGGFIALNLLHSLPLKKIKKIYFHAPFSIIPTRESLKSLLEYVLVDAPDILNQKGLEFYLSELEEIRKRMCPFKSIDTSNTLPLITISQSLNDPEVPFETSQKLASFLKSSSRFVDENTDHGLSLNRMIILPKIVDFFNE